MMRVIFRGRLKIDSIGSFDIASSEMAWILLFLAGGLEIAWAIGIKYANGFTRLLPSVFTIAAAAASFYLLGQAVKSIPVGTAYAVWSGIGAVGVALIGIVFLRESADALRLLFLSLIVIGIAGLKLVTD
jgi:quaternary ammonium compound-resistance protein SugE